MVGSPAPSQTSNRITVHPGRHLLLPVLAVGLLIGLPALAQEAPPPAAPPPAPPPAAATVPPRTHRVSYQLPTTGPLPKTYRVTLAAAPKNNPDWLAASFVSGAVRTVTAANQGRFTEVWNGLDDNFMPVPPGDYVVRGIYMPADKWPMDQAYHSLTARYVAGVGDSWSPPPEDDRKFPWIFGHCSGYLRDVDVAASGLASFQFNSIENAWNPFLVDLNRPINHGQVRSKYPSSGVGGVYTACDGEFVWVADPDDQAPHVYRTDRRWGDAINKYGVKSVALRVPATDVCAWYDRQRQWRFVYVVQPAPENKLLLFDGDGAALLKEAPIHNPRSVVLDKANPGSRLYVLHKDETGLWQVSAVPLNDGSFAGQPEPVWTIEGDPDLLDFDVDAQGVIYVAAAGENRIRRIDPATGKTSFFGKTPQPGRYDEQTLYNPQRVAVWQDRQGRSRVLVVENDGPGRLSEWSTNGELLRQWFFAHTAAYGYCLDPQRPEHLYHVSNGNKLIRYNVDYETATWRVDGVWPMPIGGRMNPRVVHHNDNTYIAFPGGALGGTRFAVYRIVGDQCLPSAAVIPDESLPKSRRITRGFWWHDANGNGRVEVAEYAAGRANLPGAQYWGDQWLDDLSLVVFAGDVAFSRLAPSGFDEFDNPIYDGARWQALLADPIHDRRKQGPLPPLYGGNELPSFYGLHWIHLRGRPAQGFYVADSFGRSNPDGIDTAGSYFSQVKLSRYLPDGKGGYTQVWRVGRKALRVRQPGEIYAAHQLTGEAHGMVGVFDSNGIYHVFTEDGFYVDTLGIDAFQHGLDKSGMYAGGGDHWFGAHYKSEADGAVYLCMGRAQMTVYEVPQWRPGLVQTLKLDPPAIRMTAGAIALPSPIAARLRGGDNRVKVANVYAIAGKPLPPGQDEDWLVKTPVAFQIDDKRRVDVQCKFDTETLYLRWRLRLPEPFQPVLVTDLTRLFSHKTGSDTVSFYMQGDPQAPPDDANGRPGDLRIVFAIVKDDTGNVKPVALGMYPDWPDKDTANPVTYGTAKDKVRFEHVAVLDQVALAHKLDADNKGFRLSAALPVSVIPQIKRLRDGFRTMVNFEATFGGHTKVWWANTTNLANTQTTNEAAAARLYPGSWAQARFLPKPPLQSPASPQ